MRERFLNLTPEDAFERVRHKRDGFCSASIQLRIPLCVVARRSTRAERPSEVSFDFPCGGSDPLIQYVATLLPVVSLRSSTGTLVVLTYSGKVSRCVGRTLDQLAGALPYDRKLTRLAFFATLDRG